MIYPSAAMVVTKMIVVSQCGHGGEEDDCSGTFAVIVDAMIEQQQDMMVFNEVFKHVEPLKPI